MRQPSLRKKPDRLGTRAIHKLVQATRDRGHQQHLISILKGVTRPAQKTDVFLVDVDVEEPANLSALVAQVRLEFGELFVEDSEKLAQVGCGTVQVTDTCRQSAQCSWDLYRDRHVTLPPLQEVPAWFRGSARTRSAWARWPLHSRRSRPARRWSSSRCR